MPTCSGAGLEILRRPWPTGIGRSQAAVSKARGAGEDQEARYVRNCIDVIEHHCEDIQVHYPRGQVSREDG